jgi:hypothetical protein
MAKFRDVAKSGAVVLYKNDMPSVVDLNLTTGSKPQWPIVSPLTIGHCGWDLVYLVDGEVIPEGTAHDVAFSIFDQSELISEVGFLFPPRTQGGAIRLRIIDDTTRTWLPMCGGMSQVIGRALVDSEMRHRYGIQVTEPTTMIKLDTDAGIVTLYVDVQGGQFIKVRTQMNDFARYLYKLGIHNTKALGVPVMHIGYFLIIDNDELTRRFPEIDFTLCGPGPHWDALCAVKHDFMKNEGIKDTSLYCMLYDLHPEDGGDARIFTRFFDQTDTPVLEYGVEEQCGTGTIATILAMVEACVVEPTCKYFTFEWGSKKRFADPMKVTRSAVTMEIQNGRITEIDFSNNLVQLLQEGKISFEASPRDEDSGSLRAVIMSTGDINQTPD